MTRRLLLLVCAMLCLGSSVRIQAQSVSSSTATSADGNFVEGVVRVKLQREVADHMVAAKLPLSVKGKNKKYVQTGVARLDRANEQVKAVSMKRVFPYAGKDEAKHRKYGLDLWYDVTYDASAMKCAQARNVYRSVEGVSYAQRIPIYKPVGGEKFITVSPEQIAKAAKAAAKMPASQSLPFNDPLLSAQWHYQNDGSMNGTKAGADINLFKAWESGVYGSNDVLVAIVDGGFDVTHPDLKDNLWINEAELNGQPGVDNDGDGYVDDIYGYNFVINSADISAHEHGTHVAGTVGATNGNGIGVCGVAGGKNGKGGVKMMVCQIFDNRANLVADYAGALVYAADRGAAIAQCSWGMSVADEEDKATSEAVHYFTKEGGGDKMNGGLCIFAYGNNGEEGNFYPGALDDVVAVGAMAANGDVAYYSNYGKPVDVTAPGGLMDAGSQYGVLSTLPNGKYGYNEGTSMACPHVSGIAALILSKYGNKNFSNETLRTLLTTAVNDLYTQNPDYVGKMGSGYIDAYKALQGKEGSVPNAVSDFTVTPSHDNALIEWTIPETEEKSIDHHVIYYSTEAFTSESDLSKLNRVSVDTKFLTSGDKMSYELTGLKATTKYYFAIVAYNRWGKASAMSPVKEATTNAGPKVALDKTTLSMSVDATKSKVAEGEFSISNKGEGVLKYELTSATKSASYVISSTSHNPNPGKVVTFAGQMKATEAATHTVVSADYQADEWPDTVTYSKGIYSYLGESDTEKPNALAQYFYVDKKLYPNGFNLTHVRFGGSNGKQPTIEIYDGSRNISSASLLQTFTSSYFTYGSDIAVPEQIYFAPGSSFWVVAKFPAGQKQPLGAGTAKTSGLAQYAYYSSDDGQSWSLLKNVLKGSSYESKSDMLVWDVYALSKNPDWSTVLNPTPKSGEVRKGESQKVTLKNDGQQLVNGTYKFNLHVKTNEAKDSKKQLTVTMNVKGYKPSMSSQQLIDFGSLLVGESKTLTVELANAGYGAFAGKNGGFYQGSGLECSSDQFSLSGGAPAVAPRSKSTMDVTFKPTKAGNFSGKVTLTSSEGISYSFTVRGVASEPAKLNVPTASFDLGDLTVGGEAKTQTFTIENKGNYPLQYVFPKFSEKSIEGSKTVAHRFGYTYQSNFGGSKDVTYEKAPVLSDEVDITSQFSESNWSSEAVDLGFKFPFYGTDYENIHITSYGGLAFNTIKGNISSQVPTASSCSGLGYISGFATAGKLTMGGDSKVSYGHKDGKFVVKYQNVVVPQLGGWGVTTVSYHMTLSPNGDVAVYYDDYTPANVFEGGAAIFVGVSDVDAKDYFVVTDADHYHRVAGYENVYENFKTGAAVKIVAPGKSMLESISSADGYVGIGEKQEITVTAKANDNLTAGELTNQLVVLTNDPNAASSNITFKANIVGDNLKPEAQLSAEKVDFGSVFRTSVQNRSLLLKNNGKNVLHVKSVTVKDGKFTVADDVKKGFDINAGDGKDIVVTLPTETKGTVEDVLTIVYTDETQATVALKGTVIGTPVFKAEPEQVSVETPYGVNVDKDITISNTGDEQMRFEVQPADWFTFKDMTADDKTASVSYSYDSKQDGRDVDFSWVDITKDFTAHMPYSYFAEKTDYKLVELPFEFPFYGKTYKKMYIYNTGFVSFDEPAEDYKQFPEPPTTIPTTDTFYKNIIFPFWGNHAMATYSTDGVFYKDCGDHVVVSYKNYGNSVMMGMDFQVIINKDGTFKFQYQLEDGGMMISPFGHAGVMDHSGTRGVDVPKTNLASGNAIMFHPVKTYAVEAGKSAQVPVTLLANQLADTYNYTMAVKTNVPGSETVQIPVSVNITGEAVPEFPKQIEIEQVAGTYNENGVEFNVVNKGKKAFAITGIQSDMFTMDQNYQQEATLFVWGDGNNGGDGPDIGDPGMGVNLASASTNMTWIPYTEGQPIVVGLDTVKFKIIVNNTNDIKDVTYPLTFSYETASGEEMKYETKVHLNLTDYPELAFVEDKDLQLNPESEEKFTAVLGVSNTGNYKLKYTLRLDPSGNDEGDDSGSDEPGGDIGWGSVLAAKPSKALLKDVLTLSTEKIDSKSVLKRLGVKSRKNSTKDDQYYVWDVPSKEFADTYNTLYHPVMNPVTAAMSSVLGSSTNHLDENFIAATRYESPAEGFNLTDLYFVGTVGNLENVDIEAYVVLGNDVTAKDKIIGRGKLHVDKEEPNSSTGGYVGEPRMLTFDKPMYINPADTFYVVLKYPAGYPYSAVMASKDGEMETNRYMAYMSDFGGWTDIEAAYDAQYNYGAFGYFMTCVEHEKGEPWIKLLSDTEGVVESKGQAEFKFEINPKSTYFAKNNKATLVIKSNDPQNPVVNSHIYLNKNGAPTIEAPAGTKTVAEGSKIIVEVPVYDTEGDAFSVSLDDKIGAATVEDYSDMNDSKDGVKVVNGVYHVEANNGIMLSIAVAPDYGTAGTHSFTITAIDANGNESSADVNYYVEETNRAPEYVGATELALAAGQSSGVYNFSELFKDADGDEMTYTVEVENTAVASLFTSETGFIVSAKQVGSTQIKVVATDSKGATKTGVITLTVSEATGIDGVEADGSNKSDVTVNENGEVTLHVDADKVVLRAYSNAGQLMALQVLGPVHAGDKVSLNLAGSIAGVYHLVAVVDGKVSTIKFALK